MTPVTAVTAVGCLVVLVGCHVRLLRPKDGREHGTRAWRRLAVLTAAQAVLLVVMALLVLPSLERGADLSAFLRPGGAAGVALSLLTGLALGVGEAMAVSFVFGTVTGVVGALAGRRGGRRTPQMPYDPPGWLATVSCGWQPAAVRVAEDGPRLLALPLLAGYLTVQELIVRGAFPVLLAGLPVWIATICSVALYALVQTAGARRGVELVYPLTFAAVVGTTHSVLAATTSAALPLVVAAVAAFAYVTMA
ncbi:hypothetical protein G5C60_04930 [Streptomyces sp. HC44]|uniref:Uncharacterized protein n=1 Tax=Streptomyces scabichelini TaxID=2711217 RepID=A0A6G4UZF8_9ACTN|nr:hypothetical protein [Streptomyces scabichelini]NGO07013.1 hypothetical protein [Streptomyces scabichelini]